MDFRLKGLLIFINLWNIFFFFSRGFLNLYTDDLVIVFIKAPHSSDNKAFISKWEISQRTLSISDSYNFYIIHIISNNFVFNIGNIIILSQKITLNNFPFLNWIHLSGLNCLWGLHWV